MGIQVELESIVQKMDLTTMQMSNQLVLLLSTGERVSLPVQEEDLRKIINARVQQTSANTPARISDDLMSPSEAVPKTDLDFAHSGGTEDGAIEFGGGGTQPEPKTERPAPAPAAPRRRSQVTKDNFGYPVVHGMEGRDPGEIVSHEGSTDEDGVGSV
jgi:hypothetical protein